MKRKDYLYGLFLLLLAAGCTRDVVLELPYVPPKLVLNASVTEGQDVSAYLSKSWFLLDSVPDSELEEGTIRVYVNDQLRGTMQQADIPGDSINPKGQFVLPGCRVQVGDRLRLEAEAPDFDPVKGETLIPETVPITGLDTVRFITSEGVNYLQPQMRVYITFSDNPDKRNFYRLIVEKVTEYWKGDSVRISSSYPKAGFYTDYFFNLRYEDPVFQFVASNPTLEQLDASTCRGTFTDDMFNGREYTVKSVFSPIQDSYRGDSITSIVHYDIRLLSISEDYYHYLTVIRNFSITFGDAYQDGLLEPSATYTNVTDGFGVIAGYQVAYWRITMPFGSEPPLITPWDKIWNL